MYYLAMLVLFTLSLPLWDGWREGNKYGIMMPAPSSTADRDRIYGIFPSQKINEEKKILQNFFRKTSAIFESVRVGTCSLASGFQLWQENCFLQKFFRFRPFFVSRRNFSDHFPWKWTIIQKSQQTCQLSR